MVAALVAEGGYLCNAEEKEAMPLVIFNASSKSFALYTVNTNDNFSSEKGYPFP